MTCDEVGFVSSQALRGERRFSSWFEAWRASLCRWLSGRSSAPSADLDAVAEEVFLRLTRYSDEKLAEHPQGYLFHIAANVVDEWHARAGKPCSQEFAWLNALRDRAEVQARSVVETVSVNAELQAAVGKLPPHQRDVLLLHINQNMTYRQIAAQLKRPPRTVRRDIAHAYAHLRSELRVVELDAISSA
jgi:RNA polymerase sigma-70 factor (ECF subfamily)